jgi:hypothetical protein
VLKGVLQMPWNRRATLALRRVVLASLPLSSLQIEAMLPMVVVLLSLMM